MEKRKELGRPAGRPELSTPAEQEILRILRRLTPVQRRRAWELLRQLSGEKEERE